ncbi:hypothetical protein [Promicromonospora sukumoe]|uniref:hypothetical protein n=1 Tax=Promicromonospora sukumoe TaxID=88382 RepID=UPI000381DED7|nr:hypothetical protein [Promicromonospora sukumoe]
MNREQAVYRRVLRRETHSPRTGAAVVLAAVLALLLLVALGLGMWWLAAPGVRETLGERLGQATSWADGAPLTAVGIVALVLGLVLVLAAVLPGRLRRRARSTDRVALLVDDGVLADAVVAAVAVRCGLDARQVSATVGRRRTTVRLTPTSGVPVDREAATDTASATLGAVGFTTAQRVLVAERGVI